MGTQLFQFTAYPNDIAITKTEFVSDGVFFLDFSRPLERLRWLGIANRWIGLTVGLLVPVVHQGERAGGYVIGVRRGDPYFRNILALWKARYPSRRNPDATADGLKIISDFATQFPIDCQPPSSRAP